MSSPQLLALGNLSFSNDSILFDTVFSTIGSATKKFVVYNNNANPMPLVHVISSDKFQKNSMELPVAFGKTISNETFVA
ncbi:hypothetical protein N9Y89_00250 [bacterium]|nr:hypothetical protein [bacterium]